ncbi:MAG: aspartate aminotransferase [Cyanobacteria bacterium QS_8_64_29]|nr:MAG: aspartate aminotransferase [Cyanobacteria bacterium QS_8_64_29]
MKLAARVARVTPSQTLAISAQAKAMRADGMDVCSLSAGEPDFDTPSPIKVAAQRALDEGQTKYGPAAGEPPLREAIARKLQTENGLNYQAQNVIVTNGGKYSLYALMQALLDPGDEVLIPAPYWVSYPETVKLAGGEPAIVETAAEDGFKLTPDQLRAATTPRTKLVILNTPANPTGSVYTPEELRALAAAIIEQDLLVVADEIYERIRYDGAQHVSVGALGPQIGERTIVSNGFSKSFAMTGWRVGYLAGPSDLIEAMTAIQSHSTSNVCTFAQYGAMAALETPLEELEHMRQTFDRRRQLVLECIDAMSGVSCPTPQGAFYVFADIGATGLGSFEFCQALLEQEQVAVVPGIAFGRDHCIRLSYATDWESLVQGMARLDRFVRKQLEA